MPTTSADSMIAADCLVKWLTNLGVCHTWVPDQVTYFKTDLFRELQRILGTVHFTTPRCPWAYGKAERANKEVLKCTRSMLSEWRMQLDKWNKITTLIQLIFNIASFTSLDDESPIKSCDWVASDATFR